MIQGDLLSAFPHRQFHTLPGLLDSWAALQNYNPNACMPMQGGSLYHFYYGLWYDPAERRTHDLPTEPTRHGPNVEHQTVGTQNNQFKSLWTPKQPVERKRYRWSSGNSKYETATFGSRTRDIWSTSTKTLI